MKLEFADNLIKAQIYDPILLPGGESYPARIEMIVTEDYFFKNPVVTHHETENNYWIVSENAPGFYLFYDEYDEGSRTVTDPATGSSDEYFYEGKFNVTGILTEPVFPVTVAVQDYRKTWRDYYLPVSLVQEILELIRVGENNPAGYWELCASTEAALKGRILFSLKFASIGIVEHARRQTQTWVTGTDVAVRER